MERLLRNRRLMAATIFAVTVLAFLPTLRNQFVDYDDGYYVTGNNVVQQGLTWKGVGWAFTTFDVANWHPLAWLSHMLDVQIFGLHAWGHHLVSLLLHGAVAALVFVFLDEASQRRVRSAAATLLFALHPTRVESVAWVAERKDLLCALFFMLACLAHLRRVRRNGTGTWVSVFSLLALMSKPMAVTLPAAFLLLDFWPLQRRERFWRLLLEKLPVIVMVGVSCVITMMAQVASHAVATSLPLLSRLATAAENPARYLRITFWPAGLIPLYQLYDPNRRLVIGSIALMVAISAVCAMLWKSRPQVAFGWGWFLATLFPVLGIVQAGSQSIADRYLYLPHIGLFTALVFLVPDLTPRFQEAVTALGAIALGLLGSLSFQQTQLWKDPMTLFTHTLRYSPGNPIATLAIGVVLMREKKAAEAERYFRSSLRRAPNNPSTLVDLGNVLFEQQKLEEGLFFYKKAFDVSPGDLDVAAAYASALVHSRHFAEALVQYQYLYKYAPDWKGIELKLGIVLDELGRADEAVSFLERAAKKSPEDAAPHAAMGIALARLGKFDQAIAELERAKQLRPDQPGVERALMNAREDAAKQKK